MTDYVLNYDNEATGPFTEGEILTFGGAATAELIRLKDFGSVGKMYITLLSGTLPVDNETITGGTSSATADVDGALGETPYPANIHNDLAIDGSSNVTWTGPAIGTTHSCNYDNEASGPFTLNEVLTFSGGGTGELIELTDGGTTGSIRFRLITLPAPVDNETITGGTSSATANVNGAVHNRTYLPLHLHRWLSDLGDDERPEGDDILSAISPTGSARNTDDIIDLLGNVNITNTVAQHLYGGSVSQAGGDTLYSGININAIASADTQPTLIQNDTVLTNYWGNGYNPDPIKGAIRILINTRLSGVDIDGKRIRGLLHELGDSYFHGNTTLGSGETELGLFSTTDTNNQTAAATISTWSDITIAEGFQTIDHNNGNGNREYYQIIDAGTRTKSQVHERGKWIQRRGTAETLHGRDAALFIGANRNFAYDGETGGPFIEDEIIAWGTSFDYDNELSGPFTVGEVVTFSGGAKGTLLYLNDAGLTGTMVVALETGIPANDETVTGVTSAATCDVNGAVNNTGVAGGTGLLLALDDDGTTGNFYYQSLTGQDPEDDLPIYGRTSNATCLVNGTPSSRVINNNWIGLFTGSAFQTNYGIALDNDIANSDDIFIDLADTQQAPPNNQTGIVRNLVSGDYVIVLPYDGVATDANGDPEPDFNQMAVNGALTAGSTSVVVDAIPDNTPQVGKVLLDNGTTFITLPYTSHDGSTTFTLSGTVGESISDNADAMVGYVAQVATATSHSYTAVYGGTPNQVIAKVVRGSSQGSLIKPSYQTPSFGTSGFDVSANRQPDE